MKFGLDVPTTGEYADARILAQLAVDAEAAGWDGFFVWDVLPQTTAIIDPWISLTAIALQTSRIRIGVLATPLARHRPYLVAQRLANLDQLSQGRVICAVGLGHSEETFAAFSEETSLVARAEQLDEGLEILAGLWTENDFSYKGRYNTLNSITLLPKPVQTPPIPLRGAGGWPHRSPFRRAAQWDGVCLKSINVEKHKWLTVEDFRDCLAYINEHRTSNAPFDVIMSGETPTDTHQGAAIVRPFAEAGATWWVEEGLGWSLEEFRERVRSGPPRE